MSTAELPAELRPVLPSYLWHMQHTLTAAASDTYLASHPALGMHHKQMVYRAPSAITTDR